MRTAHILIGALDLLLRSTPVCIPYSAAYAGVENQVRPADEQADILPAWIIFV